MVVISTQYDDIFDLFLSYYPLSECVCSAQKEEFDHITSMAKGRGTAAAADQLSQLICIHIDTVQCSLCWTTLKQRQRRQRKEKERWGGNSSVDKKEHFGDRHWRWLTRWLRLPQPSPPGLHFSAAFTKCASWQWLRALCGCLSLTSSSALKERKWKREVISNDN